MIQNMLTLTSQIESATKKLMRSGFLEDSIVSMLSKSEDFEDKVDKETLREIVKSVLSEDVNYSLIKKILTGSLISDMSGKSTKLVDKRFKYITDVNLESIRRLFSHKFDLNSRIKVCRFEYLPFEPKVFVNDKDTDSFVFNTYTPPSWQRDSFFEERNYIPEDESQIPKLVERFLRHLVNNDEKSYEYVLDWLATMLKSRNRVQLATIGTQGVGKGLLSDIMRGLVGEANFQGTSNKLFTSDFNAQLIGKRLVYVDEFSIKTASEMEKMKLLVNDVIEVEQKGKDVVTLPNYASIYMSSNDLSAITLTSDDRRFSIVELTNVRANAAFTADELTELQKSAKLHKQFADYLLLRQVTRNMNVPLYTERTELVRESSLKDWQYYIINEYCVLNAGKNITLKEFQNHFEETDFNLRNPPGRPALRGLADLVPYRYRLVSNIDDRGVKVWKLKIFPKDEQDQLEHEFKNKKC